MDAKNMFNMEKQKYAELAMEHEQSLEQVQQIVMHVEALAIKLCAKVR